MNCVVTFRRRKKLIIITRLWIMTHERGVNELERATRILFFDCMVITEEGEEQISRPLMSNNKFVTSC